MDLGGQALSGLGGGLLAALFFLGVGLAVLIKGADIFVDQASGIAKRFRIPPMVIGLTIVAMGTSAPEAAISITTAIQHNSGLSLGNVLGSNTFNVFVILGICALINPLPVPRDTRRFEMPFLVGISVLLVTCGALTFSVNKLAGAIFIVLFLLYLAYTAWQVKRSKDALLTQNFPENEAQKPASERKNNLSLSVLFLVLALAAIVVGSDFAVAGASAAALKLGVSSRVIGLTIVAFGTSLPELVTSFIAVRRKELDIAVGNIVGSNIFNILFVLGISSMVSSVPLPWVPGMTLDGIVTCIAALALLATSITQKKISRREGVVYLLCYAGYLTYVLVK